MKPIGSLCNLRCDYCYYLDACNIVMREGEHSQIMSDEMLDLVTRLYIQTQPEGTREVTFSWQGGEPTLLGIDFFKRALSLQHTYARPGMRITNALQTNGTLITDEFAQFFKEHEVLVGISLDGPREFHNRYRRDSREIGSFDAAMDGLEALKKHGVQFNTLTVVQDHNGSYPEEVYTFLKGIGSRYMQFIPIVESEAGTVGHRSVKPEQWGNFLQKVFNLWLKSDIGSVFVQHFDLLLGRYMGSPASLCVHTPECGRALALEHNGNLYSCDHFVDQEHLLGNITSESLTEMVDSTRQQSFGRMKSEGLNDTCRACEFLSLCYGGCLRNRLPSRDKGRELNYLCSGYKQLYRHTAPYLQAMKRALEYRRSPREYALFLDTSIYADCRRNDPCPCGSGKKFKHCHGG